MMTLMKVAATFAEAAPSLPSSFSWISCVLFHSRNIPPASKIISRPEMPIDSPPNQGM